MDQDQEPWRHHQQHCWPRPHLTPRYDRFITTSHVIATSSSSSSSSSSKDHPFPFWTLLWRRLKNNHNKNNSSKKNKNRGPMMMFQCCYCCDADSVSMNFGYDSISYLHNFDQGAHFNDRDDLSRSFSARFAVPTSVFDDKN